MANRQIRTDALPATAASGKQDTVRTATASHRRLRSTRKPRPKHAARRAPNTAAAVKPVQNGRGFIILMSLLLLIGFAVIAILVYAILLSTAVG